MREQYVDSILFQLCSRSCFLFSRFFSSVSFLWADIAHLVSQSRKKRKDEKKTNKTVAIEMIYGVTFYADNLTVSNSRIHTTVRMRIRICRFDNRMEEKKKRNFGRSDELAWFENRVNANTFIIRITHYHRKMTSCACCITSHNTAALCRSSIRSL